MSPSDFIDASPNRLPNQFQVAHPQTLINQANLALQENNFELANELTIKALSKNITSGLSFAQLLSNGLQQNDQSAELEVLAKLAEDLWPAHVGVNLSVASYWQKEGDLTKTLHAWNVLMIRAPQFRKEIYPILFKLLHYQVGINALKIYAEHPPNWWTGFFNYTAQQKDLSALRIAYDLRENSATPLIPEEKTTYINVLIQNKLWEEAYFAWLASLSDKELIESNFVYNGSFEVDSKRTGFDWQFTQSSLAKMDLASTNGMTGQKALHLILSDQDRINFQHISQTTKLKPGFYTFSVRYRVDRLQTNEGLSWRIRCLNEKASLLGEAKPIRTRSSWDQLSFNFEVPSESCSFQTIRLEASSPYVHNHSFKGSLWFDAVQIAPTKQQASND